VKEIAGYDLGEKLYESQKSIVYRARRSADGLGVIIKFLNRTHPTSDELSRLRLEFDVMAGLEVEGIVDVLEIVQQGPTVGYAMEDSGAESLASHLQWARFDLPAFLDLAIRLVEIVAQVHANRVVHKDLNPSNILFNPRTRVLQLIDFGICSTLPSERATVSNPEVLEGTLAYMAPEQTGRMNRPIDYRSDFYSLGATFHQLLTGAPPFSADDPMELVHAHIAREPEPVHAVREDIPEVVSEIVLKLLSKTAEARYQTAEGLLADLREVVRRLEGGATVDAFEIGRRDVSSELKIPDKLYGREDETATLLEAFRRVSEGATEVMTFTGPGGIGKTALVQEVYKGIAARRGYFVSGKFDQFQNLPYSALRSALRDLIRQILTESPERIEDWKTRLLAAVGSSGQVIIEVIPEAEWILGPQPPAPALGAVEGQTRLNAVFQGFIGALTADGTPIVLFLDDLQWADQAFLSLIGALLPTSHNLLVLGAYRDEEVEAGHPLRLTLEQIESAGIPVHQIPVGPLTVEHAGELIADSLACSEDAAIDLAVLLSTKTAGNPYFLRQLLFSLEEEKLLSFDASEGGWTWDPEALASIDITENVVDLMAGKIRGLPDDSQRALQWAACLGNRFDLTTLALVREKSEPEVAAELWPAVIQGLLTPEGDAYKLVAEFRADGDTSPDSPSAGLDVSYRFAHDRVQQAAYSLIPPDNRGDVHLRLGRVLQERAERELTPSGGWRFDEAMSTESLLDAVNHLNLGRALIHSRPERESLARLNLWSGQRAKAAAAYAQALEYLLVGAEMLGEALWTTQHDLGLTLRSEAAEAAYLSTDFERSEELVREVLAHVKDVIEEASVYEIRIQSYMAQQRLVESVDAALEVLKKLGVSLPRSPGDLRILAGFLRTKAALGRRSVDDLRALPDMTDPRTLAAMRILMVATAPIYFTTPKLFPLVAFEMVKLSVRHGNAAYSAYGYGIYGILLCAAFGDIPNGYRFGRLGLDLVDHFDARELIAKVTLVFNSSVAQWQDPLRDTLPPLLKAYQSGVDAGDAEYATLCVGTRGYNGFACGRELSDVASDLDGAIDVAGRFKQTKHRLQMSLFRQGVENLTNPVPDPARLKGEFFDEDVELAKLTDLADVSMMCQASIIKSELACVYGDYETGAAFSVEAGRIIESLVGTGLHPMHHFYDALSTLAAAPDGLKRRTARHLLKRADRSLKKLRKWAEHAPSNFEHKVLLLEAERARVTGDPTGAIELYDRAIAAARSNEYPHEEGIASELAGRFYESVGKPRFALDYLLDARHAYVRWGASAKVAELDAAHPEVAKRVADEGFDTDWQGTTPTGRTGQILDVTTVTKASRAISGEIVLEKLVDTLMRIVVENAGAQRGFLILDVDGELLIDGAMDVGEDTVRVMQSEPVEESAELSQSIVNYVAGTGELVVLNDATSDELFASDDYVLAREPKSIFCLPLLNRGELTGLVYLENNLTTGAFTEARLEVLRLLSSEMAISIDNARLYANLEHKVEQRTEELRHANEELSAALDGLKAAQTQLIHTEKMASLGQLTAGIAHEIKNPLNFVNNFAKSIQSLMEELEEELAERKEATVAEVLPDLDEVLSDLKVAADRVATHGSRADTIIRSMMQHAHESGSERRSTDVNALVKDYVELTYHGMAAQRADFHVNVETDFDETADELDLVPQDIGRVLANLLSNAYYAVDEQKERTGPDYTPTVWVTTRRTADGVEIRIADNGPGVPEEIREMIFEPFYTTKPTGDGTGLGLSLSYDIVVTQHGGAFRLDDASEEGAAFVVVLP